MPAEITFYPLGNADTALIRLADEKLVLVDFANMRNGDDTSDKRCNLSVELRKELENIGQEDFDVVCFTHLDEDHIKGMEDFFELRSKKETQNDNRPKIVRVHGRGVNSEVAQGERGTPLPLGDSAEVVIGPFGCMVELRSNTNTQGGHDDRFQDAIDGAFAKGWRRGFFADCSGICVAAAHGS